MNRTGPRVAAVLLMIAGLAAGCARPVNDVGGPVAPDPAGEQRLRQQARDALDRWDAAVGVSDGQTRFVPIGEQTSQIGDWEPAVGDNNKAALYAGVVEVAGTVPETAHPVTEVRWLDGKRRTVQTISAMQALRQMVETGQGKDGCGGCRPVTVTGAVPTTIDLVTSRGMATVPAWEFRLEGTSVRFTRPAVGPAESVTVTPPPWDSMNPPAGLRIDTARGSVTRLGLEVSFVGAKEGADKPCGIDYTVEAMESETAVVVILWERAYTGPGAGGACTMIGYTRTATVELARPLGDRAVLEVTQGMPVPVTLAD